MLQKKLCLKCNRLIDQGEKYCPVHKKAAVKDKQERHKHYDTYRRDKEATAFYNSKQWKKVRQLAVSRDRGLCVICLANNRIKAYNVVDHIKPREHFPTLALVLSNLQCLCHACHNAKTAEDVKLYGKILR